MGLPHGNLPPPGSMGHSMVPPHGHPEHIPPHHGGPHNADASFNQPPPGWNMQGPPTGPPPGVAGPGGPGGLPGPPGPPNVPLGGIASTDYQHVPLPDFSKPPPGFGPPQQQPPPLMDQQIHIEELIPNIPYWDLPAGLIVPLVDWEDCSYKPLDPDKIRLPPPAPPNDRLLAAVEAFYAPSHHDLPRDR